MYLLLIVAVPMAISLAVQSLLCRRGKNRLIRGGLVILLLVPMAAGVAMLFGSDAEFFGGLGAVKGLLWIFASGSALCGYGLAWLLFFMRKKGNRGKKSDL